MPQIEIKNQDVIGRVLRSTIGVIGRRTSDSYAAMSVNNEIKNLRQKYAFLSYITIKDVKNARFSESLDVVEIDEEINNVDVVEVGKATTEIIRNVSIKIGQEAGYFFLKEIKEDLPYNYETAFRDIGIDFNTLQLNYLTERKNSYKLYIKNSDVIKYMFKALFDVLEQKKGRIYAYKMLDEITKRFQTEYPLLRQITINDITIKDFDLVSFEGSQIDSESAQKIGMIIQKIIQEVDNELGEKGGSSFLGNIKSNLNSDYIYRLADMGVDFDVIRLNQKLVVQHVINALISVLMDSSTQNYAILMMNKFLKDSNDRYGHLKDIEIDSKSYAEDNNTIKIPESIDLVRQSELGRCLQGLIEQVVHAFNEAAGRFFVDKFKDRLGKAYILKIEEMGVNLHLIELRKNLMF